jgi:hypothetical protein
MRGSRGAHILFARAYRCGRFEEEAASGKDRLLKQTFCGFRVHVRVCRPSTISRFSVTPTNAHQLSCCRRSPREPRVCSSGRLVGDRSYHSPKTKEELVRMGIELLASSYSSKTSDPGLGKSALLSRLHYCIEMVFSQLVGGYFVKEGCGRATSCI